MNAILVNVHWLGSPGYTVIKINLKNKGGNAEGIEFIQGRGELQIW